MQTDGAEGSGIKSRFGYSVSRPTKCCWNCACSVFPHSTMCSRIAAEFVTARYSSTRDLPGDNPTVAECGVCSKWISKTVAEIYRDSVSLEEAKIKASVVSDGSYTDELDNIFCEKKVTPKMQEYMVAILSEPEILGKLSPVPFDAIVNSGQNILSFRPSRSFWLVYEWLKVNAPVYEEFMKRRKTDLKILKNSMMDIAAFPETR